MGRFGINIRIHPNLPKYHCWHLVVDSVSVMMILIVMVIMMILISIYPNHPNYHRLHLVES